MPSLYNQYPYYPTQPNVFPTQMNVIPTQPTQNAQPQIKNGGFVSVRSEEEARNYPVAQGMSVTFKNETAPYIYTKTMGFSQLDRPIFDKYKLIKEHPLESAETPQIANDTPELEKISKKDLECEIDKIWCEIQALKDTLKKQTGSRKKVDREEEEK